GWYLQERFPRFRFVLPVHLSHQLQSGGSHGQIDRQRIAAVEVLQSPGYAFEADGWTAPLCTRPHNQSQMPMHPKLVEGLQPARWLHGRLKPALLEGRVLRMPQRLAAESNSHPASRRRTSMMDTPEQIAADVEREEQTELDWRAAR